MSVAGPDSAAESFVDIPPRGQLLAVTLIFAFALALLLFWLCGRLLTALGIDSGWGWGPFLLIACTTVLLCCIAAMLVFRRMQLPLEEARRIHEDHLYRIGELEAAASVPMPMVSDQAETNAARREAAELSDEVIRLTAAVARAEKHAEAALHLSPGSENPQDPRDPLTGVHHGMLHFEQRLNELIDSARKNGSFHGLMLIGIDNFSVVHDRFGPMAGEENVWQIARQVIDRAPRDGEVYRLSSKHFAMLLPNATDKVTNEIAQNICSDVAGREFAWEGQPLPSSVSIGAVSIGLADHSEAELTERVVHAIGQAQQLGGSRVHSESLLPMLERRARDKSLSDWLKEKLKTRQLRLASQPIMPATPNPKEPTWNELLLRIEDDDGVWLTPEHYVDVLERMQLTSLIDKWVLETALKPGPRVEALTQNGGRLSINIFGSSLLRDSFFVQVREALTSSSLPTQQICFELDEAFVAQHQSRVSMFVDTVAEFGCLLALDRYRGGVGLSALRHFPAQYIKLHESLVSRQNTDLIDRAHLDWLVKSAHLAGAKVVASAVRDEETLGRLRSAGVDYVQGFALSPPSPYAL